MQRMWQREGTLKQMSFTCMKVTKGFVIVAFMDTIFNNHLKVHLQLQSLLVETLRLTPKVTNVPVV